MSDTTRATVVALTRADPRPPHHLAEDLDAGADPGGLLERAVSTDAQGQIMLAPSAVPQHLIRDAEADLVAWERDGIAVTSVLDSDYPANLRAVHDRPPLIFSQGRLDRLSERAVAVIGSRSPSEPGLALAEATARELVAAGYTVVSGLAAGIDTAAHTAALDARGATAAVIGTGLRHAYPPENARLQQEIALHEVVLSPFEPDTRPSRETFPVRNGVMSGLCLASVIVEAGVRSGTRIQARLALAHGRRVFLARPLLDQAWARDLLARPAVEVFENADHILSGLERRLATAPLID
ncbi:MAG TPA: DNA-processing protein DprA [Solirubrobacteraceae bacterium]|nr:DNA-processing protein DprA [Solirubrobacteraceae bacterium]